MLSSTDLKFIKQQLNSTQVLKKTLIQELWSGYGGLLRVQTDSPDFPSVIVKKIKLPIVANHPRGWNTDTSHQRKIKSYQVETYFYENYHHFSSKNSYFPEYLGSIKDDTDTLIILEDLDNVGFRIRRQSLSLEKAKLCIRWLAHFHGKFLCVPPKGLWKTGTYWHLSTRLDELNAISNTELKRAAPIIDQKLNDCQFKTIVHGDAKVANFCFSENSVAAVDFQYVGGGCGMKDLAYFLGSSLSDNEIEKHEDEIFNYYFSELKESMDLNKKQHSFQKIKSEWMGLYPFAWADFHRFLEGWRPGHWKLGVYSTKQLKFTLKNI